jgi:CheY-like chemotaxis protein
LRFEYEDQRAAGYFCLIDEIRFEKIINNIVYNALKFNKENGLIRTEVYPDENREHVIISISDSGHGIREQDLPHIFERFYQGDTVRVKAEGAGIGLSLVKEFTVQMGGTVSVVSKLGSGTTFTLVFPVGENELVAVPASEEAIEVTWERFPNRQNVLIVEDNKEMRYYIKEVLGDAVNIWEAVNGKDALEQMAKYSPDLIISDIMMPVMDGREFVQHVKKSDAYRKIPFITITALTDKENEITMLRSGVDDYVVKPFVGAELRTKAYNLLSNYAERLLSNSLPEESDDISPDSKHAEEFREKITEYVLARLKNSTISVFDLAYELALSERQLYRFAKNLTGCTPAQLIKEVRLMKAQELLVSGVINKIEDVSKRVGYENAGYFSRQFFERFGKRPTEYL